MEENKNKIPKFVLPIVALVIVLILIVVAIIMLNHIKDSSEEEIKGYAKLLEYKDDTYTYIFDGDQVKTYTGYSDMDDFYYDVTCVSKKLEENQYFSEDALVSSSEKIIVDYGVYDDITQVAGGRYYKVEKDNMYGIIDYHGEVIIPVIYEYITVTAVQNEKEFIFIGEKENEQYEYLNENGKVMMTSDGKSYSSNISYYNKFNDEYDTIISINVDGKIRYFDIVTGEEVLKDEENLNFKYHMQIKDKKIIIYNKNMSIKEEIDSSSSYSVTADVYYGKYIVLSERNLADGKRSGRYTVYNEEYNKVFTSENEITLVQDEDENIYFVTTGNDNVEIYNKKGLVAKIDEHTYTASYNEKGKFIVAKRLAEAKYDVYDFKGNVIVEGISNYRYSGNTLIITRKTEESTTDAILISKDKEIALKTGDNVIADQYIIVENLTDLTLSIYDLKGNRIFDPITGTKELYTDNYVITKNEGVYRIFDIKEKVMKFEYHADEFVSRDEKLNLIKLKNGYYNYNGIKLIELTEEK
ncbi:MAG: hypothetical protein Q4D02_03850 [Clostridia bacterium]|nr:hypothetical protein [Clostridia bacterium]